ncbi:sugar transferase [Streptomyces sp. NPDC058653]|uniref:sugar transferase n=1 Tax=Streptomyces sp. NPDC058653 TaxID=3346576 RepID=UPI00365F79DA
MDRAPEQATPHATDRAPDRPLEAPADRPPEHLPDPAPEHLPSHALEHLPRRASEHAPRRVLDRVLDRALDHVLDPKRLLDLTLGSLLLALLSPLLAAAALTLTLSRRHPGGAFTHGPRVGLDGRIFTVHSLTTRRYRLDLLSRLPHVVRGEMSLVGPAPLAPGHPGAAPPWRRSVRPGLTGLAQVRRRSPLPWDEPALLDQHYVEHHWIGLDLLILLRTPAAASAPYGAGAAAPRIPAQGHLSDTDHRPRGYSAAG